MELPKKLISQSVFFKENCISILATVLEQLIELNDQDPVATSISSRFHSVSRPDISVKKYLKRIHRYTDCDMESLVCAVIYMIRFSRRSDMPLTSLNVHRLIITAVVIAIKYVEDECYTNKYMAKVGGVCLQEMNKLEKLFLVRLNFSLDISVENFQEFCKEICQLDTRILCDSYTSPGPSVPSPSPSPAVDALVSASSPAKPTTPVQPESSSSTAAASSSSSSSSSADMDTSPAKPTHHQRPLSNMLVTPVDKKAHLKHSTSVGDVKTQGAYVNSPARSSAIARTRMSEFGATQVVR